jgi:hypothetical protein
MTHHKICDECETVAHCSNHGCIPKVPAPVQEPVAWVDLLKQAEEVVRSKSLWKKYIDGTPLANDIAVWMASFAQEHTTPPAAQRNRLTSREIHTAYVAATNQTLRPQDERIVFAFTRAIEDAHGIKE